jgi:hypothetical protein
MFDNFNEGVNKYLAVGEIRNLLKQKEAREIDTSYKKIFSGYLNLESILEHLTFIQPNMKKEIKESLNKFKDYIFTKIN